MDCNVIAGSSPSVIDVRDEYERLSAGVQITAEYGMFMSGFYLITYKSYLWFLDLITKAINTHILRTIVQLVSGRLSAIIFYRFIHFSIMDLRLKTILFIQIRK